MKTFQTRLQAMEDSSIKLGYCNDWPTDFYPNSDVYCYHDFFELELFLEGKGTHFINGVPYAVKPGYIYLLYPGDFHHIKLDTNVKFHLRNLKFTNDIPSDSIMKNIHNHSRPFCAYLNKEETEFINQELDFLTRCSQGEAWDFEMAKNSVERICIAVLCRLEDNIKTAIMPNETNSIILAYIKENYDKDINLDTLAAITQKSPNYIGGYFKKCTGMHFYDYLNQIRLYKALDLLENTFLSIKEISYKVGYSSPEYFIRQFKKAFHQSPAKFRKTQMKE